MRTHVTISGAGMRTHVTFSVSARAVADTAEFHCDQSHYSRGFASYDVATDIGSLYIEGTPADLREAGERLIRLAVEAEIRAETQ